MTISNVCPQWGSTFIVPSADGQGDKHAPDSYMVKFFTREQAVCSCPAYRYSGEYDKQKCKHVERVKDYGCFYYEAFNTEEENIDVTCGFRDLESQGIHLFSTTKKNIIGRPCPGCKQPMIEVYW